MCAAFYKILIKYFDILIIIIIIVIVSISMIIIIIIIIIIIVSIIKVFAGVLFVHQPGTNHAPRASVTQVNHSVHTLSTFLRIRADRSMQIFIIIIIINIFIIILDSLQVLQWLQGFWKRRLFYRDTLFQLKWVSVLGPYTFKSVITLICSWLMLLSTIEAGVEVCFRVAHAFLAPPNH